MSTGHFLKKLAVKLIANLVSKIPTAHCCSSAGHLSLAVSNKMKLTESPYNYNSPSTFHKAEIQVRYIFSKKLYKTIHTLKLHFECGWPYSFFLFFFFFLNQSWFYVWIRTESFAALKTILTLSLESHLRQISTLKLWNVSTDKKSKWKWLTESIFDIKFHQKCQFF